MFETGSFILGCNYWASHAGTNMWHDWNEEQIDKDFALLAAHGMRYVRMFPLWPDFQPLKMHYMVEGQEKELRLGENPFPDTEAGRAGVDEVMTARFGRFCDLAQKHGLHLIVGLVTGWMSGRWYVPEPFQTVNVLTDARAIKWEIKFVKYMVKTFKNHPAIAAWDLGNECNCLGKLATPEQAYLWVSAITMAIKSEDKDSPVISGMHGSFPEYTFRAEDLGEILDVLCTHPYPLFTPHCITDPIVENKSVLHAVAETVMYRGISGKPAFAEEVGTLGPMIASEENAAAYVNTILPLLWSHDCLGLLWWCGFEQRKLTHPPYDWNAVERELGLFRIDYSPKPVLCAMSDFAAFTAKQKPLPPRITDAVCVLTSETDSWLQAYGSFILAKQAGLDIEFCHINDRIPDAPAYMMPSVPHDHVPAHAMNAILDRVKNGAALYLSLGAALLSPFREIFGLIPQYHYEKAEADTVRLGENTFRLKTKYKIPFADGDAEVLARDEDGYAVMAQHAYGKGTVYFLAYPIEETAGEVPGIVSGKDEVPLYRFYRAMPKLFSPERRVHNEEAHVSFTEHITSDTTRTVVAVNCVPRETETVFTFDEGYAFDGVLSETKAAYRAEKNALRVKMPPNGYFVFTLRK